MDKRVIGIVVIIFLLLAFWFFNKTPQNVVNDLNKNWKINLDGITQRISDVKDSVMKILGLKKTKDKSQNKKGRDQCHDTGSELQSTVEQLNAVLKIHVDMFNNNNFFGQYDLWYKQLSRMRLQVQEKLDELQETEEIKMIDTEKEDRIRPLPTYITYNMDQRSIDNSRREANSSVLHANEANTRSVYHDESEYHANQANKSESNQANPVSYSSVQEGARTLEQNKTQFIRDSMNSISSQNTDMKKINTTVMIQEEMSEDSDNDSMTEATTLDKDKTKHRPQIGHAGKAVDFAMVDPIRAQLMKLPPPPIPTAAKPLELGQSSLAFLESANRKEVTERVYDGMRASKPLHDTEAVADLHTRSQLLQARAKVLLEKVAVHTGTPVKEGYSGERVGGINFTSLAQKKRGSLEPETPRTPLHLPPPGKKPVDPYRPKAKPTPAVSKERSKSTLEMMQAIESVRTPEQRLAGTPQAKRAKFAPSFLNEDENPVDAEATYQEFITGHVDKLEARIKDINSQIHPSKETINEFLRQYEELLDAGTQELQVVVNGKSGKPSKIVRFPETPLVFKSAKYGHNPNIELQIINGNNVSNVGGLMTAKELTIGDITKRTPMYTIWEKAVKRIDYGMDKDKDSPLIGKYEDMRKKFIES